MNPTTRLYTAVEMLKAMHLGMKTSHVVNLHELCGELRLGYDDAENILLKLAKAKLVSKLAGQGWAMIRDPQHITLGELANIFLWDASKLPTATPNSAIANWLAQLDSQASSSKQQNLAELWR